MTNLNRPAASLATIPRIKLFNELLKLDESDFMRKTQACRHQEHHRPVRRRACADHARPGHRDPDGRRQRDSGHKVDERKREALALPSFHPYSHLRISSAPALRRRWLEDVGERDPAALPALTSSGEMRDICSFLDRCALRVDGVCSNQPPPRRALDNGGSILCHRQEAELRRLQSPLTVVEGEVA